MIALAKVEGQSELKSEALASRFDTGEALAAVDTALVQPVEVGIGPVQEKHGVGHGALQIIQRRLA